MLCSSQYSTTGSGRTERQIKKEETVMLRNAVSYFIIHRGSSCSSYMEVYDMAEVVEEVTNQTDHHRLLGDKLCGPSGNEVKVNFK